MIAGKAAAIGVDGIDKSSREGPAWAAPVTRERIQDRGAETPISTPLDKYIDKTENNESELLSEV